MAIKKINEVSLNKGFNKFNEKVTERITDIFGEEYELEINKHFKKSDTQKIMIDYLEIEEEFKEIKDIGNLKDTIIIPMLMIKYFTNVAVPDEGEKLLAMADKLIELELLSEILNLLPEDELLKMSDVAEQFGKSVEKMVEAKEKEKETTKE